MSGKTQAMIYAAAVLVTFVMVTAYQPAIDAHIAAQIQEEATQ